MTIHETCSCGSVFDVEQKHPSQEQQAAADWRRDHRHEVPAPVFTPEPLETFPLVLPTTPTCGDTSGLSGLPCILPPAHDGQHQILPENDGDEKTSRAARLNRLDNRTDWTP